MLCAFLAACTAVPPASELVLSVSPPVREARVAYGRLFIQLTAGTGLAEAVNVELPVSPGTSIEEARSAGVEPLSTRVDGSSTFYLLRADGSALELAHLTGPTSGGRLDKWVIVAAPKDSSVGGVLSSKVAALVTAAGSINEVTIHEHARPKLSAFTAVVKGGKLIDMQWYSIVGKPGE